MKNLKSKLLSGGLLLTGLVSGAANTAPGVSAQDSNSFSLSGSTSLVTDYRFRGLSLSNKDTAIQASFNINHNSGFYLSTWGSSIENFNGAELELDIYGGHAGQIGNISTNVGFYAYTYLVPAKTLIIMRYSARLVAHWIYSAGHWEQTMRSSRTAPAIRTIYTYTLTPAPPSETRRYQLQATLPMKTAHSVQTNGIGS